MALIAVLNLCTPRPPRTANIAEDGVQGPGYCATGDFRKTDGFHIAKHLTSLGWEVSNVHHRHLCWRWRLYAD